MLWWFSDDLRLGRFARSLISDRNNDVLVSVVSLWEAIVKQRVGKLTFESADFERAMVRDGFVRLNISASHLAALEGLPAHHRDPFDHLLLAQAKSESALFVSDDRIMALYDVELLRCSAALPA